jgi:chemotaxis protein methyltransferase CheR
MIKPDAFNKEDMERGADPKGSPPAFGLEYSEIPLKGRVPSALSISDMEFRQLAAYIKANYGINLKEEKRALVTSRLHNVLQQNNFKDFSEYYNYILSDSTGTAAATLINKITTNHTFFMRETDHFAYFRDTALPYIKEAAKSKDMRVWSAGCSTGEEPYTLAMIADEFFGKEKALWDTKILATDISSKVLDIARNGIYDNERIAALPTHWRQHFFRQIDSGSSVLVDRIRNEVIYRKLNLMDELFPFKRKFHVIFCRNVMIYYDARTKRELVEKFYDLTEPGGFLFIGHSESLNREETRYRYIMPAVYRKQ